MADDEVKVFGRYIVADPRIGHGQLTFRGTRILVESILEQVADGLAWETIIEKWGGDIPKAAIGEAVRLAHEALQVTVIEARLDPLVVGRRAG